MVVRMNRLNDIYIPNILWVVSDIYHGGFYNVMWRESKEYKW
jgi:hypothetical protein